MKRLITLIATFAITSTASHGAISLTGTAISDLGPSDVGKTSVLYIDTTDAGFASLIGSVAEIPATFTDVYSGAVTSTLFGNTFAIDPPASIDDSFAGFDFGVLLFDTATDYRIYTNAAWTLPGAGGTQSLTGGDTASGSSPLGSGAIVPEPSAFALIAGCFGLVWVMVRRRA